MPPFAADPGLRVRSTDATPIAAFAVVPSGEPAPVPDPGATPLLLIHGTGSDHTTWRVTGPLVARSRHAWAMDRRGRGASGDGPRYTASLEVDDVARVATALAERAGRPIAVLGHSLGGRLAIAAAARTPAIGRVIAWEGAPAAGPGDEALLAALRADLGRGDLDAVLARFLAQGGGLPAAEIDAFRATPLWAARAALAPTIVRELDAGLHDPALGLEALAAATAPVLQLLGAASPPRFAEGARALDARLAAGSLAVVDGARHNGTHTHPAAIAAAIDRVLAR